MTLRRPLPAILWIRKTTWSLRRPRSTPGLKNKFVEPGLSLLYAHGTFKDTLVPPFHSRVPDHIRRHSRDF
ncbi:hypothetical protein TNCV_1293331 [Trichonephila clavipes]|nr:hypothetical protein TNCV_1293331 [Trichonephila clavipes]